MNHATYDLNNGLIVWYSGHGLNNGIFVRYSVHGLNNRPLDNRTCLDHFNTRLSPPYKFLILKYSVFRTPFSLFQWIVAGRVDLNPSGSTLLARQTTAMPNKPGLGPILVMVSAPPDLGYTYRALVSDQHKHLNTGH